MSFFYKLQFRSKTVKIKDDQALNYQISTISSLSFLTAKLQLVSKSERAASTLTNYLTNKKTLQKIETQFLSNHLKKRYKTISEEYPECILLQLEMVSPSVTYVCFFLVNQQD